MTGIFHGARNEEVSYEGGGGVRNRYCHRFADCCSSSHSCGSIVVLVTPLAHAIITGGILETEQGQGCPAEGTGVYSTPNS